MCTEGALVMYSSSNCVFYSCTGVIVTISYSCALEIQQRPYIRAVSWMSSNSVFYSCTGVVVTMHYSYVLEIL